MQKKIIPRVLMDSKEDIPYGVQQVPEKGLIRISGVSLIKKCSFKTQNWKTGNITLGETSRAENWCGRIWCYRLRKWFFLLMQQSLIFSTCRFLEVFFCISLPYTHNKHGSAFIQKYGNLLLFNAVVWVLSKKNLTNLFLLNKCKIWREPIFGRSWLHIKSFCKCFI